MRIALLVVCLFSFSFGLKLDCLTLNSRLENGLEYFIKENKLPKNRAYFTLIVNAGSIDETPDQRGLAHFIEHMAFNGSKDYSKNGLIKKLESLGVEFGSNLNAYTTYEFTVYEFNIEVTESNLEESFKIFRNWIDGISFDDSELEKEKGIIIEEDRVLKSKTSKFTKSVMNDILKGSVYENKEPIGDMNVVKLATKDEIKAFYEKTYQPKVMKFIAVGDFNATKVENLAIKYFSSAKNKSDYKRPSKNVNFKKGISLYNYDSKDANINSFRIDFVDEFLSLSSKENLKKQWLQRYISNLINLAYERKKIEENLLLKSSFLTQNLFRENTFYVFNIEILDNDFKSGITELFSMIKSIDEFGFSKSDFDDIKQNFIKNINNKFDEHSTRNSLSYLGYILKHSVMKTTFLNPKDDKDINLEIINSITLDDVKNEFKRIIGLDKILITTISSKGKSFDEKSLKKIWDDTKPNTSYSSSINLDKELINIDLKPIKIKDKLYNKSYDFYQYKLENGATIVLKKLDTKKDFIDFSIVAKGGTSTLPNPKVGEFAVKVLNQNGVGNFNKYEFFKKLSGKQIYYSKNINQTSHGFYGNLNSKDLEALMQILHIEMQNPRMDRSVLELVKQTTINEMENQELLPNYKFLKEYNSFYYDNDPLVAPLTKDEIKAIKNDELVKIIYDKFTNPAAFKFIFVGDIDIDEFERLVEKYIATIPKKELVEDIADRNIRPRKGEHVFTKNYQTLDKSEVLIRIQNAISYTETSHFEAKALEYILDTSLREKIREKNSDVYTISANIGVSKEPFDHSTGVISFSCNPKNSDKIINKIKNVIDDIKKFGSQELLENYKKIEISNSSIRYKQPYFWRSILSSHMLFEHKIYKYSEYEKIINEISNDDIIQVANQFLNNESVVIGIKKS
ncbi:MAG: insulinase family protein [Campylobacteraceae bacterium]|nr:insulinase family protein [Campylobacteraceae bacterium]